VNNGDQLETFVQFVTDVSVARLVPEVRLHLARNAYDIFEQAHTFAPDGHRPYWAFAWPGGQALARHILDTPALVAGRTVLDLGAGSGIAAIAAAKAGAAHVVAADTDPMAAAATRLNAATNCVAVSVTTHDLLGEDARYDLIIIGDLVYEPELKDRVGAFLDTMTRVGARVLYGDRTTARRPPGAFRLLAEYGAPLEPAMIDNAVERARVWTVG
jgi:predicted nicotinamide N-methyase